MLAATTVAMSVGALLATASPAAAGPYRADCSAWITSTGRPGGGFTAVCNGGPVSVQYRVVGLCQNIFTLGSRWVYGGWMTNDASHVDCSWSETPQSTYYQTR
ncbi:hypothetical protein GCM10010170_037920 [Dactylosporangium salmoneum]|uniref:Secreted protein n=2 Tax=Dactylosporangium salmoneum TaxID=53361 RepID=A0ABN3GF36_9ACTN